MIAPCGMLKNYARHRFSAFMLAASLLCILLATRTASAQTTVTPTTTTLWAGTQDFTQFGFGDLTEPGPGLILPGTAISPVTGNPVRHLWYGDAVNGLCRVDPDVDAPSDPPGPGLGNHTPNLTTCVGALPAFTVIPGQMAYDPVHNFIYAGDISRLNQGLFLYRYDPAGDNGQGSISATEIQPLVTPTFAGSCPPPIDPTLGGTATGTTLNSVAFGPDGNLYFGYLHGGFVARILDPANLQPSINGECQNNLQVPIIGPDEANKVAGNIFGLAWVGHTLFSGDAISPWQEPNADSCLTAANNNTRCGPTGANAPLQILASFVQSAPGGIITDGNNLYFGSLSSVTKVANVTSAANLTLSSNYGGTFCFITGLTADAADPNGALYVGVDCDQGGVNGGGAIYKVLPTPAAVDVGVTMSSPSQANSNSNVTFTMVASNHGTQNVAATITDTLPSNATFSSFTTTAGACSAQAGTLSCLMNLASGASATVTVTVVAGTTNVTNTATIAAEDLAGNPLTDTVPGNNTASSTTLIAPPPPPVTTDIQVVGAAQNGGPNAGTIDTFTWQIKDNQGAINAPNVVFTNTLPADLQFASVSSSLGTCVGPAPGSAGGTINCSLSTLPGGQTMVVTVNAVVTDVATISTTGSATFQGTDSNPANNAFTVTIQSK